MQGRELIARRDFCSAQGLGLLSRRYFAPRRVENCFRAGILLREGFGTAFAPGILLCILRHSYGVHPVTLVYQGLRYRLPLPEVFRPVGAGFSFSKQKCKVIPTENRIFAR